MKTKRVTFFVLLFSILLFSPIYAGIPVQGEPVPGAEIYVELDPGDEPIMATTVEDGEYTFEGLKPGVYNIIVRLPQKSIESFSSKEAEKIPGILKSGYYQKKNQYFLSKNRGLFLIGIEDVKQISTKDITLSNRTVKKKDSKNSISILKFKVTGKEGKIVISLGSLKPKQYNSEITSALTTGPFSQALSNIEDL